MTWSRQTEAAYQKYLSSTNLEDGRILLEDLGEDGEAKNTLIMFMMMMMM
jgi:hypothetical protein